MAVCQAFVAQGFQLRSTSLETNRLCKDIPVVTIQRPRFPQISCTATGTRSGSSSAGSSGKNGASTADASEAFLGHDYFKILGVSVNTPPGEIRKAYWKLQKRYHPDVAGEEGHEMALLLNEAYNVLMDEHRRAAFEGQWRSAAALGYVGYTGQPRSKWSGPDWPQGIFVDEVACVGCQECKFIAPETFTTDPETNKARVRVQWGDTESKIKAASESCPVNCIHTVPRDDLAVLEFLMQPRERESCGVSGGGWERPEKGNIFTAAQNFKRRLQKQQAEAAKRKRSSVSQETPAQRAARQRASQQTNSNPFWRFWAWGGAAEENPSQTSSRTSWTRSGGGSEEAKYPWQRMFGRASTSELLRQSVAADEVDKVVAFVQDWASMWACSSDLPLPLPFRPDPLYNGVQLTLLSIGSGTLTSMGSLLVTIDNVSIGGLDNENLSAVDLAALGGPLGADGTKGEVTGGVPGMPGVADEWVLSVKRQGLIGDKALPGEGRIVRHLRKSLATRGKAEGYEAYHLAR